MICVFTEVKLTWLSLDVTKKSWRKAAVLDRRSLAALSRLSFTMNATPTSIPLCFFLSSLGHPQHQGKGRLGVLGRTKTSKDKKRLEKQTLSFASPTSTPHRPNLSSPVQLIGRLAIKAASTSRLAGGQHNTTCHLPAPRSCPFGSTPIVPCKTAVLHTTKDRVSYEPSNLSTRVGSQRRAPCCLQVYVASKHLFLQGPSTSSK